MQFTFVLSSLWLNGGNRVVIEYANYLTRDGNQVSVCIPKETADPVMVEYLDPKVTILQTSLKGKTNTSSLEKLVLTMQIASLIPGSDFVFATHSPTVPAVIVAAYLLRKGKPVWLYQDSIGMFHPISIEGWLQRNGLRFFQGAFVINLQDKQYLRSLFPKKYVSFIGEGISDAEFFRPFTERQRLELTGGRPTLFTIGDTRPRKGFQDVLQAAETLSLSIPDLQVWIASKEQFVPDTSLEHKFFYRPNRAQLGELYAACDVFVFASWNESFGLPGLEAMASGAPVVLTDSGGIRAYARNEENCLIAPVKDPGALADRIKRVLFTPDLAQRFRLAGPPTASGFLWQHAFQRFKKSIEELLQLSNNLTN